MERFFVTLTNAGFAVMYTKHIVMITKKRGDDAVLTQHIKRSNKKEYNLRHIKPHVNILPYFVLSGLKQDISDNDRDSYALAEMFMTDTVGYEGTLNDLYRFAEYAQNTRYDWEDVLTLLYKGGNDFTYPPAYFDFNTINQNLVRLHGYKFDEPRIAKALLSGVDEKDWYPETLNAFEKMLPRYDIDLFVKIFAITSPRTHFKANLVNALKAYRLFKAGKSFHGHGFMQNIVSMLYDLRKNNFSFDRAACRNGRRKIVNFYCSIVGDKKAVTVDSWIGDAYGIGEKYLYQGKEHPYTIRTTEYDVMEAHILSLAESCGYEPRQIVSMLWCGIRKIHSRYKTTNTELLLKELR